MRKLITAAAALAALLVLVGSAAAKLDQGDKPDKGDKNATKTIQILTISDWHGQLEPLNGLGGAPVLKAYLDQYRAANPDTLTFMAGDSFGATPPVSTFFGDEPAVNVQNMLGVNADTFGNHNFDGGVDHLQHLVDLADFPFVSANLKNLSDNLTGVDPWHMFTVDGVKIAVIGITNEEAPTLVSPGAFGTMEPTDSIRAADEAAKDAKKAGADLTIVLTHKGIRGHDENGNAFGELIDFANGVNAGHVDLIVGDHTDFSYVGYHQDGRILAVENKSKGVQFSDIQLVLDAKGKLISKTATQHDATSAGVTPDAGIQAYIDDLKAQLAPIFGTVIGQSSVAIPRSDSCGQSAGRTCESLIGDVTTDAMRLAYGTDFAITNSGGLRAALTCPGAGAGGFCPSPITTPPFPITRGAVLGVLPFGNVTTTVDLTGAEIKAFLENGVSAMPGVDGRYSQVSGLCFTYDIAAPVGSRVTSIVRQAADGSCTGAAVDPAASYSVASNDFVLKGGDGYPNVYARAVTRNIMDQDVADYVTAHSPLTPALQGRISCVGATCPVAIP